MFKIVLLLLFLCSSINADNINYVKKCVDPDWMPFESIDKNGKHIGIVADVLALIEKKTNLKFILIPTKSWKESIEFMEQNKCDILPLASITKDRQKYMSFTPAYIKYPEALVVRIHEEVNTIEEALSFPIGVTKGYAAIASLKKKYPDINIVEVDGIDDAFAKLRAKEIYSYSDTLPIIGYKLQQEGILDLKISHIFGQLKYNLNAGMGVRKERFDLHQILTKAINDLDKKELDIIINKWINININDVLIDYNAIYKIIASIILIIIFILYWNYRLNTIVKVRTRELKKLTNTLESQVKERTKKIKHLLNNAGQGFLTLDKNFLINDEYSKECEHLLGDDIANKDISNILFSDDSKAKTFKNHLTIISNISNEVTQLSAMNLLSKTVDVQERTIAIDYKLIDNLFMLILTDVSDNKELENKVKHEKYVLKMTVSVIKDNDIFFDTKNSFHFFTNNIQDYINKDNTTLHNINTIYREIHTFKGSFLQLFMNDTVSNLHNIESELSNMLANDTMVTNEYLLKFLKEVNFETFTNTDLENIVKVLGENFINNDKFISVKKQFLQDIEMKCVSLIDNYSENEAIRLLDNIRSLSVKKIKSYLDAYARLLSQMSHGMQKPIYEFEAIGDDNLLLDDKFIHFIQSLVNIFRNALVHGIETSDAREYLKKNKTGTIACSFSVENHILTITIADDGSGIDVEKIKEKVGIDSLSMEEAYSYIFQDKFSTQSEVNEFSGRGVGLSAVKMEVDKLGGNIEVVSELHIGTKFIFTIGNF